MHLYIQIVQVLLLIFAANGAPILVRAIFGSRFAYPVDGGQVFFDGNRILGEAKTWRGMFAAIVVTCPLAVFVGYSWMTGLLIASGAMAGDLFSSFIKRRLAMPASAEAPVLDQVPESLVPCLLIMHTIRIDTIEIIVLVSLFFAIERVLSKLLFQLGLRQRPY